MFLWKSEWQHYTAKLWLQMCCKKGFSTGNCLLRDLHLLWWRHGAVFGAFSHSRLSNANNSDFVQDWFISWFLIFLQLNQKRNCLWHEIIFHAISLLYVVIQVNLCQKLLFLHQLTHNMTTDCSWNYHENYKRRTWAEHG